MSDMRLICLVLLILRIFPAFAADSGTQSPSVVGLSELLKTNSSCSVKLEPPWIGIATNAFRTGYYFNAEPPGSHERDHRLFFDLFFFSTNETVNIKNYRFIARSFGKGEMLNLYAFRTNLPTDCQITAARTVSALTNLLGPSQGMAGCCPRPDSWGFFKLKGHKAVETLKVICISTQNKGTGEWDIEGMEIFRGSAKQTARP